MPVRTIAMHCRIRQRRIASAKGELGDPRTMFRSTLVALLMLVVLAAAAPAANAQSEQQSLLPRR